MTRTANTCSNSRRSSGRLRRRVVQGCALALAGLVALAGSAMAAGPSQLPNTPPPVPAATPPNVVQILGLTNADTGTPPPPPATPTDDLRDLMDALASAPTAAAASAARQRALDILEGNPIAGRAYSGIPLLNWNMPDKIKTVPAGGSVTVTEVRFDDQVLTDTALLRFADPSQPFSVTYRIADLTQSTGELSPVSLGTASGSQIVSQGLGLPRIATGTTAVNNFHPEGQPEETREGIQQLTVQMPAPNSASAFLDPNVMPGHEGLATLEPASPSTVAAAEQTFGFGAGTTPTAAQKQAAIATI